MKKKSPPIEEDEIISRAQIKRELQVLLDLGRKMIALPKVQRKKLPLTEEMQDALVLADKIKNKHEAFKRHVHYIAKLMRDEDLEGINQGFELIANKHQQESLKFTMREEVRDSLIAGKYDVEQLLTEAPTMERQKLRQLIRQAAKEVKAEKPTKSYRDLLAYIKEHNWSK
jgi:ribosome-associated protein